MNNIWKTDKRYTHWMANTRIYKTRQDMRARCSNDNRTDYKYYGWKGISVCERRNSFLLFYEDMKLWYKDDLYIDRIDVNKNYFPDNCRRVDMKTQCRNRTSTNMITYKGITLSLTERSEVINIPRPTLSNRINRNKWSVDKAFNYYNPN
jgi:hypothetical protein